MRLTWPIFVIALLHSNGASKAKKEMGLGFGSFVISPTKLLQFPTEIIKSISKILSQIQTSLKSQPQKKAISANEKQKVR